MYIKAVDVLKDTFVVIRKIISCEATFSFSFYMRTYTCIIFLGDNGIKIWVESYSLGTLNFVMENKLRAFRLNIGEDQIGSVRPYEAIGLVRF